MSEYDEDMDRLGGDDDEVAELMEDDEAAPSRSDAPTPDVDDVVDDDDDEEEEEEEPGGGDDDDDDETYFERGSAPGKRPRASSSKSGGGKKPKGPSLKKKQELAKAWMSPHSQLSDIGDVRGAKVEVFNVTDEEWREKLQRSGTDLYDIYQRAIAPEWRLTRKQLQGVFDKLFKNHNKKTNGRRFKAAMLFQLNEFELKQLFEKEAFVGKLNLVAADGAADGAAAAATAVQPAPYADVGALAADTSKRLTHLTKSTAREKKATGGASAAAGGRGRGGGTAADSRSATPEAFEIPPPQERPPAAARERRAPMRQPSQPQLAQAAHEACATVTRAGLESTSTAQRAVANSLFQGPELATFLAQLDQVDAQLNMLMPAVATDAMAMQMIRALQALRGDDLDAKCAGGAAQLMLRMKLQQMNVGAGEPSGVT